MLNPDTILQSRYRITAPLGQGGMGAVYKAIDQRLSLTVALKETLADTDELRRAFEREARLLANLNHPSLPRVIDHFIEDKGQYLVMDYVPNDDLGTMLGKRGTPFSIDEVMRWSYDLLEVLDYLHRHEPQIIHRDIKPNNIKISAKGKVVLLDFGLAKGKAGEMTKAGLSQSIFGYSLHYASLEQMQGDRTSERSDLYSLAVSLYNLLTGIRPPDALTRAAAVFNDESDPLIPIQQLVPNLPKKVSETLMSAASLKPASRPKSAKEMLLELTRNYKSGTYTESGMLPVPEVCVVIEDIEVETNVKVQKPLSSELKPKYTDNENDFVPSKHNSSSTKLQNVIHRIKKPEDYPPPSQELAASEIGLYSAPPRRGKNEKYIYWNVRLLTYSIIGKYYKSSNENTKLLVRYLNSHLPDHRKILRFVSVSPQSDDMKFYMGSESFTFSAKNPIYKEYFLEKFNLGAIVGSAQSFRQIEERKSSAMDSVVTSYSPKKQKQTPSKLSTQMDSVLTSYSSEKTKSIYSEVSEIIKGLLMVAVIMLLGFVLLMSLFGVVFSLLGLIVEVIKPNPNKVDNYLTGFAFMFLSIFSLVFVYLLFLVLDDKIGLLDYNIDGSINESRPAKIPVNSRTLVYWMLGLLFPIIGLIAYIPFNPTPNIESKPSEASSDLNSNKSVNSSINKLTNAKPTPSVRQQKR